MPKKTLSINFPIERVVLSDLLPYEVPITFSNRHFYNFIVENQVKYSNGYYYWKKKDTAFDSLVMLLLGLPKSKQVQNFEKEGIKYSKVSAKKISPFTIPFTFNISHKADQYRHLSLIHPRSQIFAVEFYKNNKDLITYYCDKSKFSLRSAKRVAGCTYVDKKSLIEQFDTDGEVIEVEGENYENLKSFFVYDKYSSIFNFYESDEYHDCEGRYSYLSKLDISNCFDSIYTHSIAWAVYSKEYAKNNLSQTKSTFPNVFDSLMQQLNYNETNGIVIGPELSRIFAEIILQAIDNDIVFDLEKSNVFFGVDYHIFRYVDDFFVFYDNQEVFSKIKSSISLCLTRYKLNLNKSKEYFFNRPVITPITIAKKKIADLLSDKLKYKIEYVDGTKEIEKASLYFSKSSLITDFKSILHTSDVSYGDILNYTLSILEKKVRKILLVYTKVPESENVDKQLISALVSLIEFSFFIYSMSPKVNGTIKLCRIMQQIILFVNDRTVGIEYRDVIFRSIFNGSCSVLEDIKVGNETPVETLYLLVLMRQLGKFYWLDEFSLCKYFGFVKSSEDINVEKDLNYFSIVVLLFYIENKKRYDFLKEPIEKYVLQKYIEKSATISIDSEITHMTLDLIACPYVSDKLKNEILEKSDVPKESRKKVISYCSTWFTKWSGYDFAKELDAKVSQDVY
ncbi:MULTISPECIES: antiviral reverse transcriptase Drt3b [Vibrio]|uniref:Antiviral reverse transcriptase Drt3b n=1 Tax=Vibrio kanaloae TaxID=170673 RepID=A0ABV4LDW7_9VIBR|nr:antiviral reverse transcriptase Drt3b [Vibrio kanaloae]OEF12281.1 ABC transporter ATP-binding protein [Vibrio kanaloae 5S-149]